MLENASGSSGTLSIEDDSFLYVQQSGKSGLRLISAAPLVHVTASIRELNNSLVIMLMLLFALGSLASVLVSRYMYRPIAKLVRDIPSRQAVSILEGEFDYIRDVLHSLSDENLVLKRQMEGNRAIIHEYMIYSLLMGINDEELDEQFRQYWLSSDQCAVLCVQIDLLQEKENRYFIKTNIIDCIWRAAFDRQILFIQINSNMVCMIVRNKEELKELLCLLEGMAGEDECIRMGVGVGGWVTAIHNISQSYLQAHEMLDYRKTGAGISVVYFGDLKASGSTIHYPVERENQIINLLLTGNSRDAIALMETVYRENSGDLTLIVLMQTLCGEFALTVQRAVHRLNDPPDAIRHRIVRFMIKRKESIDCRMYLDALYKLCEDIANCINTRFRDQENLYRIKKYIVHNLDRDVSLDMIASEFDYTPSYFSRYFKKNMGLNFVEYLTRERIRYAKNELLFTDEEVQNIATAAGFSNVNSFSRTFRQYEGISPSQYRRNVRKLQAE